jgi:hypothetical protein
MISRKPVSPALSPEQNANAHHLINEDKKLVAEVAGLPGVHRATAKAR